MQHCVQPSPASDFFSLTFTEDFLDTLVFSFPESFSLDASVSLLYSFNDSFLDSFEASFSLDDTVDSSLFLSFLESSLEVSLAESVTDKSDMFALIFTFIKCSVNIQEVNLKKGKLQANECFTKYIICFVSCANYSIVLCDITNVNAKYFWNRAGMKQTANVGPENPFLSIFAFCSNHFSLFRSNNNAFKNSVFALYDDAWVLDPTFRLLSIMIALMSVHAMLENAIVNTEQFIKQFCPH